MLQTHLHGSKTHAFWTFDVYIKTHRSNVDLFDVVKIVPLLKNKSAQELDGVDM